MNIGFFSETYRPDINGVITSIESFRQELERRGHTVYIFAPSTEVFAAPWKPKKRERNVFRLGSFSYPLYKSIRVATPFSVPVARQLPKLQLDLVHSHTPFSLGLFASWVARSYDIPHVHTYHTLYPEYAKFYFPGFKKWNEKGAEKLSAIFCNAATEIISPSDGIKRKLKSYGITKPITTVPTGIDADFFGTGGRYKFRSRYRIPAHAPLLITVARLGREKSIDYLLRSFRQLLRRRPDAYYAIIGDGPARLELETLARELGVADRTIFTGFVGGRQDVIAAYRAADVFVFASKTDTQCLTLLEAAATGLPLIARYDAPLKTALTEGRNGFFVRQGERAFAEKTHRLLADPKLQKRFSAESLKTAKAQSVERRTGELLQVYRHAIDTTDREIDLNAFQRIRAAFQRQSR